MPSPHSIQRTLRLSPDLWLLAEQAASKGNFRSMNEFFRTCIRAYIDDTGDVMGSRRHFTKTMGERLDRLEATVIASMSQQQMLTSRGIFTILDELKPEEVEADPPSPEEQISAALEASKRYLPKFMQEQNPFIAHLEQFYNKRTRTRDEQLKKTDKQKTDKDPAP